MNPENASILGYILLLVGIALSIIGYVIYLNIRGEKADTPSEDTDTDALVQEKGNLEGASDAEKDPEIVIETVEEQVTLDESASQESHEEDNGTMSKTSDMTEPERDKGEATLLPTDETELIPAATLFREGVTGRIVVQVGDRQYTDLETLKKSKDWSRVRSLASDLADWIEERAVPSTVQGLRAEIDSGAPTEAATSSSDNMIAQINEIINRKVKMIEGEERDIQLVEGLIGALEVRVGLEKFPIDEVPYDDVRELIQEAVSQWEKSQ